MRKTLKTFVPLTSKNSASVSTVHTVQYIIRNTTVRIIRVRILRRKPDKCLKSFPPCYPQSPLQLCFEISISSNSRNLLQFLQFSYCTLQRRKPCILPSLGFKKSNTETSSEFGLWSLWGHPRKSASLSL